MPKPVTGRAGKGKSACQTPPGEGTVLARALRRNQPQLWHRPRHMAQPQHPFSGRRRQARWGNRNRDGAPGTGPPGSGERKAGAEITCRVDVCRSERR